MGQYLTQSPDGIKYDFTISGDTPSPAEMARIQAAIANGAGTATDPAVAPEEPIGNVENLYRHFQKAGKATQSGGADTLGWLLSEFDPDNPELQKQVGQLHGYAAGVRKERDAIQTTDKGFFQDVAEAPTFGGKVAAGASSLLGTLAESAPPMIAGAVVGAVTENPAMGWAASTLFSIPQAMDSNVSRQIQEHGHVTDWNKAGLSAVGQGAIEGLPDVMLGKMAGLFGRPAAKMILDRTAKKVWSEVYKKTGKGLTAGALSNAFEEGLQQGMERWQADLPLMDDQAKQEYVENALVGSILGTVFGTVAGASEGIGDYAHAKGEDAVKKEVEKRKDNASAMVSAMDDADADAAAMRAERTPTSPAAYDPKKPSPEAVEEDHSAPAAEEAAPIDDSRLPPGLREEAVVSSTPAEAALPEPPVPPDHVRLYHGGEDPTSGGKRFTTPSRIYARDFRNAGGQNAVHYVDIPKGHPDEIAARGWDDIDERDGTNMVGHYINTEVSEETAKRMKPLSPRVPAPVTTTKAKAGPVPKVSPSTFNEADYRKSVETLRSAGLFGDSKVAKTLGIKKHEAVALMEEMVRRRDAHPAGRSGKYLKVVAAKTSAPPSKATGPTVARDYSIKPVLPANHAPFFAEMNGKRRSPDNFKTEAEALDWVDANVPQSQKKSVSVAEDKSSIKHGVYETLSDESGKPMGEKLVSHHDTEADAKAALKELNPAFSSITNEQTHQTQEAKQAAVASDVKATLGPYNILQNAVQRMAGTDRVDVHLTDKIDDRYMASKGHKTDIDGAIVEGVFTKDMIDETKGIFRRVISLANLTDTNLTQDQRDKRIADTLNHEVIHAIVNLKLLTPDELGALFRAAMDQKVPGKSYTWAQRAEARNPDLRKEGKISALLEEGVAEMFRHYVNDPSSFRGEVRTALGKIADFIRKLIGLGRKHDAQMVMDAIFGGEIGKRAVNYGGVPARDQRDVFYSLLKPDNAYLKSLRVVENTKLEKANAEQWMSTFKNAGVKQEELWWQNIEGFLNSHGGLIPKQELMNFIKAPPDIRINNDFPNPKIRVNLRAGDEHADIPFDRTFDDSSEEALSPKYGHMKTKGGEDYAEATFFFTPKDDEPNFIHSHWPEMNVLAHVRFKTINEMGEDGINRKVLFIEEMQSDLHQSASKAGGYYSETLRDEANDLHAAYEDAAQEYDNHYQATREEKNKLRQLIDFNRSNTDRLQYQMRMIRRGVEPLSDSDQRLWNELHQNVNHIARKMMEPIRRHAEIGDQLKAIRNKVNEKQAAWQAIDKRMWIPNAPYRTNWEDYVIRRMIRHAGEHGFDAVAWHGQQESVNEAENWGGIEESIEESPVETESWRPLPKTYKLSNSDTNVTPIVNRYLEKLPKIVRELAQRFGATLDINDASQFDTAAAKAKGSSYTPPDVHNTAQIEDQFPERKSVARLIDKLEAKNKREAHLSSAADIAGQEKLINQLRQAYQIALNQRDFMPAIAFHRVGLIADSEFGDFEVDFDSTPLKTAMFWAHGSHRWSDTTAYIKGTANFGPTFPWKHFRLNLNGPMREGLTRGDVPRYSQIKERAAQVEADPRFEQWFHGSTVTNPDGTPKVVYHYTNSDQDFGRFNKLTHFGTAVAAEDRMAGSVGDNKLIGLDRDTYFENYAQPTGQRIYPVFLNIRRPLKIFDTGKAHRIEDLVATADKSNALTQGEVVRVLAVAQFSKNKATDMLIRALEKKGYDGFVYINAIEDRGSISYVSFRPEQIKSIFNQGTWDSTNPDIMYSKLEERGRDLWQNDDKFKSWFSGSRVVDESGNPFLMFTGTSKDKDFNTFKAARNGIWFTSDPASASQYAVENDSMGYTRDDSPGAKSWDMKATNTASRVVPSFLSIKNPYIFEGDELERWARDPANSNYKRAQGILFDRMKANGYDGVKWGDGIWVAFHGSQIKSALSTEFSAESDSFKFSKVEPMYSVLAPLGQRVPVGPTPDNLEITLQKATYNNVVPFLQNFFRMIGGTALLRKLGISLDSIIETGVIQLQDRMLPLGKLIDRVRANGGKITNENDAYLQQALMSGQVKGLMDDNERLYYQPLSKALHDLPVSTADAADLARVNGAGGPAELIMKQQPDHRVGMAEVYLYAQHALERNAEMALRNARFRTGTLQQTEGSGMTDYEAQTILNWFASKPFGAKFNSETDANSIRSRYRALIAATKDVRVDGGLTPDFRTMVYRQGPKAGQPVDTYKDYAPLRGFLNDHPNSIHDDNMFAKTGLGFNIRGREDPTAAGRAASTLPGGGTIYRSLGSDLIANALLQNQEAIIRAGKNKVDNAFYQAMLDNPAIMSTVATEIVTTPTKWTYNPKTGNVQQRPDPLALNQPDILKFKVKGDQKYVRLHDPRLAKAMGAKPNLGGDGLGAVMLRGMRQFNRFLAMTVTSLNPEFVVSNWAKDMTSALVNLSEYEAAGLKSKVIKSLPSVYAGIRRALKNGDRTSPAAMDFWEFVEHGGMTSFQGLANLEDSIKQINEAMKLGGQGSYLTKSWGAVKAVTGAIENWNLAVENTTRLAVYTTLRDHYLSQSSDPTNPANIRRAKEQAAFSSKRKTVDFNMGGEMKPVFDAFYMFYNASMQGSLALVNPLIRSRRMKKVWASVVTAGLVQDMLMSLISPEDDDGKKIYDGIQDYVLEHNMILIDPFGLTDRGYIQIPMPYGFNALYNLGRASGSAMRGHTSPGKAMASGVGNLFNSFNPLGEFNNVINWVAPTIADPAVALILNQDFTGAPIAPPASPYGPDEVASQRYWNNTSPAAVTIADWLSRVGGIVGWGRQGDMIPGLIEISPNQLAYVMEQMTGGLGATAMRAYNLVAPEALLGKGTLIKAVQGDIEDVDINDIPFLRKVVGNVTTKNDLQNYIKDRDKVLRVRAAIKDAQKAGDGDLARSIRAKYADELKISGRVNAIENARKKLSSRISKIRDSERLTDERKQELIKKLKERQDKMVGIGNRVMQAADL